MTIVNIEFCHIYMDEWFSKEHITSIKLLKDTASKLREEGKDYYTTILVDDVNNTSSSKWRIEELLNTLSEFDVIPDFLALESKFSDLASKIVNDLPANLVSVQSFKKDNKQVFFYRELDGHLFALKDFIGNRDVMKCVTLSAAWLLCKLGIYRTPEGGVFSLNGNLLHSNINSNIEILTILPCKYEYNEINVTKLISALGYRKELQRVNYIFY